MGPTCPTCHRRALYRREGARLVVVCLACRDEAQTRATWDGCAEMREAAPTIRRVKKAVTTPPKSRAPVIDGVPKVRAFKPPEQLPTRRTRWGTVSADQLYHMVYVWKNSPNTLAAFFNIPPAVVRKRLYEWGIKTHTTRVPKA